MQEILAAAGVVSDGPYHAGMTEQAPTASPTSFRAMGEACGVPVRISTDDEAIWTRLQDLLPPGWIDLGEDVAVDPEREIAHFTLTSDPPDYVLMRDDAVLARSSLEIALHVFDAQLRAHIALHSPDRVFVHAGVVGHRGKAIVIPGMSFSGKTTLVAALVRAGATYYSDEYAVFDAQGLIHPYPKPLSVRLRDGLGTRTDVAALGGTAGTEPLPLGVVVVSQYRRDATWQPRTLSPGEAVINLVAHTIPAQLRPEETMTAIRTAVDGSGAVAFEGERGDAAGMVEQILNSVPGAPASNRS
jgi:hypothetical protein